MLLINSVHLRHTYTKRNTLFEKSVWDLLWSNWDWNKLFSEHFGYILSALFHRFSMCIHSSYHLSYRSIVVYVFLNAVTLIEVFPCFFLSCKANARVKLAKTGHGPHSPIVVLFYVMIDLYRSVYCLCVNVYCTSATG
jgi:hypothetical protein